MSELPAEVLAPFLSAYNAANGAGYSLRQVEPREDGSCDYLYADPLRPREPVKVQLTLARVNVETADPAPTATGAGTGRAVRSIQAWANHPIASQLPTHRWGSSAGPAVEALFAKARRLRRSASDLILVVLYDFLEYDDDELPEMRSAARWAARKASNTFEASFREVWVLWSSPDCEGKADRLLPPPDGTEPPPLVAGTSAAIRWEDAHQAIDPDGVVHVMRLKTADALCGAYLLGDFSDEPKKPRCLECDALLSAGMTSQS